MVTAELKVSCERCNSCARASTDVSPIVDSAPDGAEASTVVGEEVPDGDDREPNGDKIQDGDTVPVPAGKEASNEEVSNEKNDGAADNKGLGSATDDGDEGEGDSERPSDNDESASDENVDSDCTEPANTDEEEIVNDGDSTVELSDTEEQAEDTVNVQETVGDDAASCVYPPYIEFHCQQQTYHFRMKSEAEEGKHCDADTTKMPEVRGGAMNWGGLRLVHGRSFNEAGTWSWGHWSG